MGLIINKSKGPQAEVSSIRILVIFAKITLVDTKSDWNVSPTINTTFVMEPTSLENRRRAYTACSTISAAVRCLVSPILEKVFIHHGNAEY